MDLCTFFTGLQQGRGYVSAYMFNLRGILAPTRLGVLVSVISRVFLGYLSVFNLILSVALNLKIGYGDSHGPVISKELPSSLMGSRHFEFKGNILVFSIK